MNSAMLLTLIIFLPTAGLMLALMFNKKDVEPMRYSHWRPSVARFILDAVRVPGVSGRSGPAGTVPAGGVESRGRRWNIDDQLGYDGISLPLVPVDQFHHHAVDARLVERQ